MFFTQEGETKREYKNHYRFDTELPSCKGEELKLKQRPTIIHDMTLPELLTVYADSTTLLEQNDVMKEDDLTALNNIGSFSVAISKFIVSFNSVSLKLVIFQTSNTYSRKITEDSEYITNSGAIEMIQLQQWLP